jgi:ribonuclease HII
MDPFYCNEESDIIEIGIDEAGRGPLFGRVYSAGVVLPKTDFDYSILKDSKKFTSKKKILEVYEYIKKNALFWEICYNDEKVIDKINIRRATHKTMHDSIVKIIERNKLDVSNILLLIDGNDFSPLIHNEHTLSAITIESGDNSYGSIAAASILAKVERDKYIEELCEKYPGLNEKYGIASNKGYGSKKHIEGIKQYGITEWHRKTYGICKTQPVISI